MKDTELAAACRLVAGHFEGEVAETLFEYYAVINMMFFFGRLPQAFILTSLTPYGRCIGLTKAYSTQPIILLHPKLKTEEERFYTLVHEAMHVYVRYVDGYSGTESHSNEDWLTQCMVIAHLLGYGSINFGRSKVVRAKKEDGGNLRRISTGSLPYECSYHFPQSLPKHTGRPLPPVEQWLESYRQLHVTLAGWKKE